MIETGENTRCPGCRQIVKRGVRKQDSQWIAMCVACDYPALTDIEQPPEKPLSESEARVLGVADICADDRELLDRMELMRDGKPWPSFFSDIGIPVSVHETRFLGPLRRGNLDPSRKARLIDALDEFEKGGVAMSDKQPSVQDEAVRRLLKMKEDTGATWAEMSEKLGFDGKSTLSNVIHQHDIGRLGERAARRVLDAIEAFESDKIANLQKADANLQRTGGETETIQDEAIRRLVALKALLKVKWAVLGKKMGYKGKTALPNLIQRHKDGQLGHKSACKLLSRIEEVESEIGFLPDIEDTAHDGLDADQPRMCSGSDADMQQTQKKTAYLHKDVSSKKDVGPSTQKRYDHVLGEVEAPVELSQEDSEAEASIYAPDLSDISDELMRQLVDDHLMNVLGVGLDGLATIKDAVDALLFAKRHNLKASVYVESLQVNV